MGPSKTKVLRKVPKQLAEETTFHPIIQENTDET